jgi:hypothetical protein
MYKKSIAILMSMYLCGINHNLIAQSFYDQATIQTIHVYMSQSNWDQLLDNAYATSGDYIMADSVAINGVVMDSIGVKYKGNSSYNVNQVKNPWHIELDTYKEHDYQGYKDIKLANVAKDPSFLRDVLGYQVVRQYMDAPLANYANLYVNGTLIGLYSNTEAISKAFVKSRFGHKSNTFFSCSPPEGASPISGDYPNLVYLGTDSTVYYDAYEIKSNEGWQDLINLCDTLSNHTSDIENTLDIDRAIWMLALDNAMVNLDSYIGAFSQNYYLYKDNFNRFMPIIWDLNESFGTFSSTGTSNLNNTTSKQQMSHLLHSTDANWPLISKILAVPTYKKMYLAHLKTIFEENFTNNGSYYTMAQTLKNTIDAAVQADPNKFFTYAQFNSNITSDVSSGGGRGGSNAPGITNLMNGRYSYLMAQADFAATQPSINNVVITNTPSIGGTVSVNATVTDENNVYLRYRTIDMAPFEKIEMYDDGNHNDGAANDNVFGADFIMSSNNAEYYIYAENSNIGKFSPVRAEHDFYTITLTGGITPGDIVINELMASNDTTVTDPDGEYEDWIEIYNNSTNTIDISGYRLSDDISDLSLFTFPTSTLIQPNSYIIVWADKDLTQTGYHADFKISASGETLYLADSNQTIIDSVAFTSQNTDEAYGRYPNGTGPFQVLPATFSAENSTGLLTVIESVFNNNTIKIYPNPAQSFFNIELANSNTKSNKVFIYNALGQEVYSSSFQEKTTIPIDNLSDGVYLVKVGNTTQRLVIEN